MLVGRWRAFQRPVRSQLVFRGPCNAQRCGLYRCFWLVLDLYFKLCRISFEQSLSQPFLLLPAERFMKPFRHGNDQLHTSIPETRRVRRMVKVEFTTFEDGLQLTMRRVGETRKLTSRSDRSLFTLGSLRVTR